MSARRFHFLGLLLLIGIGALPGQEAFDDSAIVSIRVQLGVGDKQPTAWDGDLSVSGGELTGLAGLRPKPDDSITGNSWKTASWQGPNFRYPAFKHQPVTGIPVNIFSPGLVADFRARGGRTRVSFETEQGNFRVDLRNLPLGRTQRFLGGRAVVDRTITTQKISDDGRQNDFASLASGPDGQLWAAWVAYRGGANEVLLRHYDGNAWGEIQTVTDKPGDVFLAKVARVSDDNAGGGRVWVVWSDRIDGNRDLYARAFDGSLSDTGRSPIQRLSEAPQPDLYHNVAADSKGRVWVVWQGFRGGQADIFARFHDGEKWSPAQKISTSAANDWEPAIAADGGGNVYAAWDTYDKGNYDVLTRRYDGESWQGVVPLADTPKFEAHVTLACDDEDRLWAAWSESGAQWGKDDGFGIEQEGTRLYEWRGMSVAVLDGGRWLEPAAALDDALPADLSGDRNDSPVIRADGAGGVWVFFRRRNPRIKDIVSDFYAFYATWELWGVRYAGGSWSEPVYFPHSRGRMDMRSGFVRADDGGIAAAWPTDNRDFSAMIFEQADIYVGKIAKPPAAGALAMRPRAQPEIAVYPIHPNEARDLETIRNYEIRSGGKTYKIYRGDTHRHTEFSMDGYNDGSLLQAYRYAIDAASLDYYANSEHNYLGGPDVEYHDWLLQQFADCLHLPGRFIPLFAYERSVRYPNGHRNIIFAKRGVRPFRISLEEFSTLFPFSTEEVTMRFANPDPVGTKDLYAYLKQNDGIAISHTSATNMGTDWRDNDPEVEPLVEIYQGDRVSAEYEGAPRAAYGGNPRSAPGGYKPAGYVWNAWAKGYKLGVQAASDHVSTHISYACTISEDGSREGLLDAMRKRHSYGATDNIVLDYRLRAGGKEYLQGDIAAVAGDFRLSLRVIGTEPIRQIDIIKNQEFVLTRHNLERDVSFEFSDAEPTPGENYYYVRVQQDDGQIAWSSPIWVTTGAAR